MASLYKPLAVHVVEHRFSQDAEDGLGTEIILVVKTVDGFQKFIGGQAGILDLRHLVAAVIHHLCVGCVMKPFFIA